MQLPRGTFRSIKKGIALHTLCRDLIDSCFTGCCTFTSGPRTCTFVMESGRCILAEDQELQGTRAWAAITSGDREGEAVLVDLSGAQIKISREFNKTAAIGDSGNPSLLFQKKKPIEPPIKEIEPSLKETSGVSRQKTKVVPVQPAQRRQPLRNSSNADKKPNEVSVDGDGLSLLNKDLDALDAMDLETITQKIRSSAKATVERLNLDHLMNND